MEDSCSSPNYLKTFIRLHVYEMSVIKQESVPSNISISYAEGGLPCGVMSYICLQAGTALCTEL